METIKKSTTGEMWNRDCKEEYWFRFDEDGELTQVRQMVKIDSSGNGITSTVAIEKHEIPLESVPRAVVSDLRKQLNKLESGLEARYD